MVTLHINPNKLFTVLMFLSFFSLGYTSNISFTKPALTLEESAYARPALGKMAVGALKFLGSEIAKGAVTVGVESLLSPKKSVSEPLPSSNTRQSIYSGSFFQCSLGCKYYWSSSTGWLMFNSQQGLWQGIAYPSRTVVRTHDIYMDHSGNYFTQSVAQRYGFSPQYGWVSFW
jgi:hypothetical protein